MIVLPALGLGIALRERDRPLLDVSLAMALATAVTNKPYWGLARNPWDPIVLGALLVATAVLVRRRLRDEPRGFTAERLARADADRLAALGTLSTVVQPAPGPDTGASVERDGGRFGGGGATTDY